MLVGRYEECVYKKQLSRPVVLKGGWKDVLVTALIMGATLKFRTTRNQIVYVIAFIIAEARGE